MQELFADKSIPKAVKQQLKERYQGVAELIEKLQKEQLFIVAFGQVSTGKSSLLNALLGRKHFRTAALHGETKRNQPLDWQTVQQQSMVLIDTPGTDEFDGDEREQMAHRAATQADILLFVLSGDISDAELQQLRQVATPNKAILLVLNKSDLYSPQQLEQLKQSILDKIKPLKYPLVFSSADPKPQLLLVEQDNGEMLEQSHQPTPQIEHLQEKILQISAQEGKALAALNAGVFASQLQTEIAQNIVKLRQNAAHDLIKSYSLGKAISVAFNPVPVADLLLAAGLDIAMLRQLSKLYGLSLSKADAIKLASTISAQLALLMGTVWTVHLLSSTLKTISIGLSTGLTATAQGALAYYAGYLLGKIAEQYFAQGNSWGEKGPKALVKQVVDGLDRNSILQQAGEQIVAMVKNNDKNQA